MFLTPYFPLAAALTVRRLPAGFLDKVLEGNLGAAGAQANRWAEDAHQSTDMPYLGFYAGTAENSVVPHCEHQSACCLM